ncbi:polysaccharide biosynthesis/export family protein [Pseudooceanicola sp. 200-1SW]|uniref:polysaccharide biosynthesis/export family protein n=1 Tax=Pseudooceanicola sp. 200-1SW TaxID=3425949 RepID=UPI003D7F68E9
MRRLKALFTLSVLSGLLGGCGVIYHSPSVDTVANAGAKVQVVEMNAQTVMVANRSAYAPRTLPAILSEMPATGSTVAMGTGALPEPALSDKPRLPLETRLPPAPPEAPYQIGVGDVLLLAVPQSGSTLEELTGLLAASNSREGYTVQDDGAIAIPNVGRVNLAGLTLEEAEARLFQRLVENQIDPTFSLEIAEFNSKKVAIGGAVGSPRVVPIQLTPLYLDEALAAVGGVQVPDIDLASVRIYRDGTLYQIPVTELYSNRELARVRLLDGDSVFVDTSYDLTLAQAYFDQQIRLADFRQSSRLSALQAMNQEISLRQSSYEAARTNYMTRLELGGVERDYAYLAGEVGVQGRFALPFETRASLADALYGDNARGMPTETADISQIYVLRASDDPREFGAVTAWHLDVRNAANLLLATKFELRPDDVIFIAEQPVTRWNRTLQQIVPSLITQGAAIASR